MLRPALIFLGLVLICSGDASLARQDTTGESAAPAAAARTADLVVARVSGRPITESQVIEAVDELARQREMSFDQLQQRKALLFNEAVSSLITITLLKNEALRQNLPTDTTLVDRQFELLAERYSSPEEFQKALAEQGLTEPELRQNLEESIGMQQLINMITGEIRTVTDDDIEAFYRDNPDKFLMPERVRAAHILLRTATARTSEEKAAVREKLKKIRDDIESGVISFADAAAQYSQDETNAANGGDLGLFSRGQTLKIFEDIAFTTWPGTISSVFETSVGFHIIKVLELLPEGPATMVEAAPAVKEFLEQNTQRTTTQNYVEKLKKEAVVETFMTREDFLRRHVSE